MYDADRQAEFLPPPARPRRLRVVLLLGVLLNLLGWLGNAVLLREEWRAALSVALVRPRDRGLPGELVTLVPEFVYAAAWVWLYLQVREARGRGVWTALLVGVAVWAVGAATAYVGVASAGFLPPRIALLTSGLALASFVAISWLLPLLLDRRGD